MTAIALGLAKNLVDSSINKEGLKINVTVGNYILVTYDYDDSIENPELYGVLQAVFAGDMPEEAQGPCRNAYIVKIANIDDSSKGKIKGLGRLLYYIAMHFAEGDGITADRIRSSADAVGVWNNLFADSEVTKKPLDDYKNDQTPEKEDDCNLASSGVYSIKGFEDLNKAADLSAATQWNPNLSGKQSAEYIEKKSSKLNYVYYGDSQDAIDFLNNNNIPVVVNGINPLNEYRKLLETLVYKKLLAKLLRK